MGRMGLFNSGGPIMESQLQTRQETSTKHQIIMPSLTEIDSRSQMMNTPEV